MTRWPVLPTLVVALAVLTMIALGVWQLDRKGEKEALIALYRANLGRPATSFPQPGADTGPLLFRRSSATCLHVVRTEERAGRDAAGKGGFAVIAHCATGAEGPGVRILLGIAARPGTATRFTGGRVRGWIVPDGEGGLIERMKGRVPGVILSSSDPVSGLALPAAPDPANVTNNHLAYAGQWFLFAGAATIIYLLALRRRRGAGEANRG